MNAEVLKLNIVQQIINSTDVQLLEEIYSLLGKEKVVGYKTDGTTITKSQYIEEMNEQQQRIANEDSELYSVKDVRRKILDANNLG